jgi:hypothetical protein
VRRTVGEGRPRTWSSMATAAARRRALPGEECGVEGGGGVACGRWRAGWCQGGSGLEEVDEL